jgi:non-homologous end joining protein Ku
VIDLMEALRRSLEAQPEAEPPKKPQRLSPAPRRRAAKR